jgi:psp operon transcriptional activator
LLDRLSFEVVTLPPLRHRQSDIPVLADHFGRRMALEIEMAWPGFSKEAMEQIQTYDWPGNVRELRNVVERAVYRWAGQEGPIQDIQFDPFESPWRPAAGQGLLSRPPAANDGAEKVAAAQPELPPPPASAHDPEGCADFRLAIAEYEKAILAAALERCRWNQRAAAAALSLTYDQLRHAMRRHELQG